jgi:hypothetical protein
MTTNLVTSDEEIISKLKTRGHWRVRFIPLRPKGIVLERLSDCLRVVEEASVSLRGWNYPHTTSRKDEYFRGVDYYSLSTDWNYFKEHWRMYQSAQFIHLVGLREDWFDEALIASGYRNSPAPGECLNIVASLIYELTEVFEFLSRLVERKIYEDGVSVTLSLVNTKGRVLWVGDPSRAEFMVDYRCDVNTLDYSVELSRFDASESPTSNASKAIGFIYERFGFDHYTSDQIHAIQAELYAIKGNSMK